MAIRAVTVAPKSAGGSGKKDWNIFGVGIGGPQSIGADVCPPVEAESGGTLQRVWARSNRPGTSTAYLDLLRSSDQGATWASIFPPGNANKIVLPTNSTNEVEVATFADPPDNVVVESDWWRVDLLEGSGEDWQNISILVEWN